MAGLGAAHPHGHLAAVLLPAWTLLLAWSIAWSVAAVRSSRVVVRTAAVAA